MSKELERLREIVKRQDEAIDIGIAALQLHAMRKSLTRQDREVALTALLLAKNERLHA